LSILEVLQEVYYSVIFKLFFLFFPKFRIAALSVDGKCLKIRHGAQKFSEAVFCTSQLFIYWLSKIMSNFHAITQYIRAIA